MHKHNACIFKVLFEHLFAISCYNNDLLNARLAQNPHHVLDDTFLSHGQQGLEIPHP